MSEIVKSLGYSRSNLLYSVYFGLTLGAVYVVAIFLGSAVISGIATFKELPLSGFEILLVVVVSLATGVWEQTVFSGFLLARFQKLFDNEWLSVSLTAFLFTLLHIPILWLDSSLKPFYIVIQLLLFTLIGFGNAVLMLRARNILAPILSHTFWALSFQIFT